jgi:hypothetical protein
LVTEIYNILKELTPITLKEMDGVKLMDRTDTKYTFNINELPFVLTESQKHYHVLNIEGHLMSRYKTLYYDTEGFDLYNKHHSGKLNRYKIRHRTYIESDLGFLEVKFKNNKGRTIKTRIKENELPRLDAGKAFDFLTKALPFNPNNLVPKIWVNYSRITLVNKNSAERLTIDLNLEFVRDENSQLFNQLVIAEVKQDSKLASPFVGIMKRQHIREGSISKYCMAIAKTYGEVVKQNNFKQKLNNINKIISNVSITNSN